MTSDVLVSMSGIQMGEHEDAVEVINKGKYYKKNDMHYVVFDEVMEGFDQTTKNILKFKDGYLTVHKKGVVNVNMEFEENKKSMNCYATPYGDIMMGIDSTSVRVKEEEDHMQVDARYILEANYEYVADCAVKIEISSAKHGISLLS